jgi:CheY-like chemotaxis protein
MHELEPVEILLVEDSEADAELTIRALRKHKLSNNVIWVKDGAQALEFIFCSGAYAGRGNGHPKLILLDIKMPKLDGIEVLRRLKAEQDTRRIPVVMLSSSAENRDLDECYRLGANSYLVKPVDFAAFTEVVSHAGLYWTVMNRLPD